MSPESAEGRYKRIFYSILLKTEQQIGRRPIEGDFMFFLSIIVEKWAEKIAKFSGKVSNFRIWNKKLKILV